MPHPLPHLELDVIVQVADGNLNDWWTEADAKEFETRAKMLVDQFKAAEILPGLHVNGELTLGENGPHHPTDLARCSHDSDTHRAQMVQGGPTD